MSFLRLPNEIILLIATNLTCDADVNCLSRAHGHLYNLLNHESYKRNIQFYGGWSLPWLCSHGYASLVRMMLEKGARPDIYADGQALHPMLLAAREGHADVVEAFLKWGIDPNRSFEYWRADWAAKRLAWPALMATPHESVLRVLHAHGADMKHPMLLCRASGYGALPAVKFLLDKGGNLEEVDAETGFTPLGSAASVGNLGVIRFLLDAGAKPNDSNGRYANWTPICSAAARGDCETVHLLPENDAKIHISMFENYSLLSALSLATDNDHQAVAELLLENIDLDSADEDQAVLLAAAANFGMTSMIEQILSKGSSADARSTDSHAVPIKRQRTALSRAARNGYADIVELLLQSGADPSADSSGDGDFKIDLDCRPLFVAIKGGHEMIVRRLLDAVGDSIAAQLHYSDLSLLQLAIPQPGIFDALLHRGADPYQTSRNSLMPILAALRSRSVKVLHSIFSLTMDSPPWLLPSTERRILYSRRPPMAAERLWNSCRMGSNQTA